MLVEPNANRESLYCANSFRWLVATFRTFSS